MEYSEVELKERKNYLLWKVIFFQTEADQHHNY